MSEKKITIDELIDIMIEVIDVAYDRFSDDGKISIRDGIDIVFALLKGIAKAYKN